MPDITAIIEETRCYHVVDLARLFRVPCHTVETAVAPEPRGADVLLAVSQGRLDAARITEESLAAFRETNPTR